MYALVAMGIVLIYKSSSVPNLAQGGLTMLGAYMVLAFANGAGLPMPTMDTIKLFGAEPAKMVAAT
eukprot:gene15535-19841_t